MPGKKQYEKWRELIQHYTNRFNKANQVCRAKHQVWAELDTFDRGEQWKGLNIPPWVPKPVTNYVRYVRTLKRANLASNIPKSRFSAIYEEDKPIIERLQKAYDHVWDTEKVNRTIRRCIDRVLVQGTAIAYVYMDMVIEGRYFGENDVRNQLYQGRIRVERWPNANFFPDPDADRIDKCKWIETTEILPLSQVKENPAFRAYCEKQGTLKKLDTLSTDLLENDDSVSGTIYNREYKAIDGGQSIKGDEMVTLHAHWERYFQNGRWHLNVSYYIPNVDFFLLRIEDMKPSEYPFAVLYDEEEENDFWGTGTIMDIIENQKIINKVQQTASILGVLHQNPQKVVTKESGINAQQLANMGNLPGQVWVSNIPARDAVSVIQPPDIPRGLFELDDRTRMNIREMVGVNEAYTGESVGSLTTSTGVSELIERATIRDRDKASQIDEFVERISHLIVLNIIYNWQESRPITTVGSDGSEQFEMWEPIDPLTAENLRWRVKSNVYAKAPLTQAARRQQADKLMQMQGQFQFEPPIITPEEWIKMQEFDDEPEILARMERDRARIEQERAQNLAQTISQLALQANALAKQGQSQEQIQMAIQQIAEEVVRQQQSSDLRNGVRPQVQKNPGTPRGVTGEVQMANMARGM